MALGPEILARPTSTKLLTFRRVAVVLREILSDDG